MLKTHYTHTTFPMESREESTASGERLQLKIWCWCWLSMVKLLFVKRKKRYMGMQFCLRQDTHTCNHEQQMASKLRHQHMFIQKETLGWWNTRGSEGYRKIRESSVVSIAIVRWDVFSAFRILHPEFIMRRNSNRERALLSFSYTHCLMLHTVMWSAQIRRKH